MNMAIIEIEGTLTQLKRKECFSGIGIKLPAAPVAVYFELKASKMKEKNP